MILLHVHRAATVQLRARIAIHSARTSRPRRAFAQISMQRHRRSLQRDNRAHAHTCSISIIPLDDIIAIAVRYSLHAYIARICIGRLA